jgi:hypothetical protein
MKLKVLFMLFLFGLSKMALANNESCPLQTTTAINPTTSSIVDFPTQCDVPAGWVLVDDSFSFEEYQIKMKNAWTVIQHKSSPVVKGIQKKWNDTTGEREDIKDAISDLYNKLVD